jgi:hypothetical protein
MYTEAFNEKLKDVLEKIETDEEKIQIKFAFMFKVANEFCKNMDKLREAQLAEETEDKEIETLSAELENYPSNANNLAVVILNPCSDQEIQLVENFLKIYSEDQSAKTDTQFELVKNNLGDMVLPFGLDKETKFDEAYIKSDLKPSVYLNKISQAETPLNPFLVYITGEVKENFQELFKGLEGLYLSIDFKEKYHK